MAWLVMCQLRSGAPPWALRCWKRRLIAGELGIEFKLRLHQRREPARTANQPIQGGQLRTYEGAVLFVDILGIGALTTTTSRLVEEADFSAVEATVAEGDNQVYCAVLLSKFRKNLMVCQSAGRHAGLKVAQLSDSAFIWCEDAGAVVEAATTLFWLNLHNGIFARAGMAFGQIVEPEKTATSIGRFICGEAVTRAVGLEAAGKGARIFVDTDLPARRMSGVSVTAFQGLPNASDFRMIDEFLWFSVPNFLPLSRDFERQQFSRLIGALGMMRYSPMFRWNEASAQGRVHLGATLERVSRCLSGHPLASKLEPPAFVVTNCETYLSLLGQGGGIQRSKNGHQTFERLSGAYVAEALQAAARSIART
jgi:hypothetical protein